MQEYVVEKNRWFIWLTFLIAILLSLLPLPAWANWCQPEWVCLVLIYWLMALPYVFGMGSIFFFGLFVDFIQGSLLGEHAFCLVMMAYFVIKFHQQIRVYPFFQQASIVFLLLLFYKALVFLIQAFLGVIPDSVLYWLSAVISALLWSWIFVLLRDWRRKVGVE